MKILNNNGTSAAVIDRDIQINNVSDMLDLIATSQYEGDCVGLIVYKECLGERFFDLKTGYAGEILQKFSNYNMKIAIIGDFSMYKSKSLHDFMYESNKGNRVFFKATEQEGLAAF